MQQPVTHSPNPTQDPLMPPNALSTEERWIVRIHGKDLGPFSSRHLYPKLLLGEIEPDSLLLDQGRFSRCRLREVEEFQPFLHLHNTQNPILLKEKERQDRDKHWEEKGKTRTLLAVFAVLTLVGGSIFAYFFLRKSNDAYLADGDHVFQIGGSLEGVQEKKQRNFAEEERKYLASQRGRPRAKGAASGAGATGPTASAIDFESGGGSGIPTAQLRSTVQRNVPRVFQCLKDQQERDSRFYGGTLSFSISGATGKITRVEVEDTDVNTRILVSCIRRSAVSWSFPTFGGTANIQMPIKINKR